MKYDIIMLAVKITGVKKRKMRALPKEKKTLTYCGGETCFLLCTTPLKKYQVKQIQGLLQ